MKFVDFLKEQKVRKATPDLQLVKSLMAMSERQFNTAKLLKIDNITKESVLVMCYEALRELVEALAVKHGYKVYSHEAFTYFLKELGEARMSEKFDRYRKLRNGVNYYGKQVPLEEVTAASNEIKMLLDELKDKHLKDIN